MTVTVKHTKVSTVADSTDTDLIRPSDWNADHDLTGLGTAAEKDAGVPLGVATLDAGGAVPLSQIPASIQGTLSYQGTWNASTNTPALASSVGTKGYFYTVSVAGSTNLDGITDWNIGDMAVFNGTVWEQIDNTDAVTSVNGYTGTVVLTASDISGFGTMASQNANSVAITGGSINGTSLGATTAGSAKVTTLDIASGLTLATAAGTSGQVLTSAGAGSVPVWATPAGGVTLANDTTTSSNLYPTFAAATTGAVSTVYTGNAKLLYKPSTGELQSSVLAATNGIVVNNTTIAESYTIASGQNAMSVGPITVASGQSVTVSSGQRWVVL